MYGSVYHANGHSDSNGNGAVHTPLDVKLYASGCPRQPSALRALVPFMNIPGMLSLGGGMPNPQLFPFASVTVTMKDGFSFSITEKDREDMIDAFQYTGTAGIDPLLRELRELQLREHQPQLPNSVRCAAHSTAWTVAVTNGSQDGLCKMMEALIGPQDCVLTETPTYSGALSILRPLGCRILGLQCDAEGIIPDSMAVVLSSWDEATQGRRPRFLYCIPTGQNPAGSTMSDERKQAVYALCCRYDLIVLEDDPYFFLTYGTAKAPPAGSDEEQSWSRPVVRSLWSLDTEGRVVRFDSLSKVLSSGLRLGFVTGPPAFVSAMLLSVQCGCLHSSGIAQVMAAKYLRHLGAEGWRRHVNAVSLFYLRRRDLLCAFAERHLQGLAEFSLPTAGMFVWFRLLQVTDSKRLIEDSARKALVLLVPGQVFMPDDAVSAYVRASFSLASEPDMELAMQRLAKVLREEAVEHKTLSS